MIPAQRSKIEYQGFRKKLNPYLLYARDAVVLVLKIVSQPK
jgi:hypothetical protein